MWPLDAYGNCAYTINCIDWGGIYVCGKYDDGEPTDFWE